MEKAPLLTQQFAYNHDEPMLLPQHCCKTVFRYQVQVPKKWHPMHSIRENHPKIILSWNQRFFLPALMLATSAVQGAKTKQVFEDYSLTYRKNIYTRIKLLYLIPIFTYLKILIRFAKFILK